jgi:hypothetical protein
VVEYLEHVPWKEVPHSHPATARLVHFAHRASAVTPVSSLRVCACGARETDAGMPRDSANAA